MFGMSRDLYRAARDRVRGERGNPNDADAVFEAYRNIMEDVDKAKKSNRLRVRRYAAQAELDKEGQQRAKEPTSKVPPSPVDRPAFKFDQSAPTPNIRPRGF